MRTPSFVRRWRTQFHDAQSLKLRSLLTAERDRTRALEKRLADLQKGNEDYYKARYDATGGPQLDPAQPFGTEPVKGGAA